VDLQGTAFIYVLYCVALIEEIVLLTEGRYFGKLLVRRKCNSICKNI
jgi:hypothetical protein